MTARPDAETLLAGPRGRRLCWEWLGAPSLASDDVGRSVRRAAAQLGPVVASHVRRALARTVDLAAYWQPPYEEDDILRSPLVMRDFSPVAEALLADPVTDWWGSTLALDAQRLSQFVDDPVPPRMPTTVLPDPLERLRAWREDQGRQNDRFRAVLEGRGQQAERRSGWTVHRGQGADPAADYARLSGSWWSTPNRWEVPPTARDLSGVGPVALWLTEDTLGWHHAHCWPVTTARPVRVYEIDGVQSWADLVAAHPLDVTDSRRPDWRRATGSDGPWLIPDWSSVAREYDAVHLSVLGYLTASGRAIAIDEEYRTVLAGWDPDATFWLTDALVITGPVDSWHRVEGSEWTRGR